MDSHLGVHSWEDFGEPLMTDSEKIEYLYQVAVRADKLLTELAPQVGPILESVSKNPMLKMFMR
jgi:hypothetical protein